ncbi:hypothetical protein [Celerinatantimonas yamalensis]|uniref:Uncharacterized protein n=1 Tax=Celerinatantimonas yamalensis TaxID=559956 RepID=A0ABW9G7N4_9GAMM
MHTECIEESGGWVERSESVVTLTNGLIVMRCIEFEDSPDESDMVCSDGWISDEVVSEPEGLNIKPRCKYFINKC